MRRDSGCRGVRGCYQAWAHRPCASWPRFFGRYWRSDSSPRPQPSRGDLTQWMGEPAGDLIGDRVLGWLGAPFFSHLISLQHRRRVRHEYRHIDHTAMVGLAAGGAPAWMSVGQHSTTPHGLDGYGINCVSANGLFRAWFAGRRLHPDHRPWGLMQFFFIMPPTFLSSSLPEKVPVSLIAIWHGLLCREP